GGFEHVPLERLQDFRRASLQEAEQAAGDLSILWFGDRPGAGAGAELAREVAIIVARLQLPAVLRRVVAPGEDPAQRAQRLPHLGCAGERAEVAGAVVRHPPLQGRARPALLLPDPDVQEVLVVLELGVERWLLGLDQ